MNTGIAQRTPAHGRLRALHFAALIAGLVVNLYWSQPYYNWDMLPCIAAAFRFGGASKEVAHQRTYQVVRETVPPQTYAFLTTWGEYRSTVAADPEALAQQLPGYALKPAYPLLILGLGRSGLNPVSATVWISRVGYVVLGVLLLLWLATLQSPVWAVWSAWGVMGLPFALNLGRLSTPDALSAVFVVAGLWLVFERRRFRAGSTLLLLSMTARPDNLLWLLVVAACGAKWLRSGRVAAAFAITGIVCYAGLAQFADYLGWATLFHHSFVQLLLYPKAFEPTLSLAGYVSIYLRQTHPANLPAFLLLFVLLGGWLARHRFRRYGWPDTRFALLAGSGVFAVLHWLLLPGAEDRYLAPAYIVCLLLLIQTLFESVDRVAEHAIQSAPPV